MGVFLCRDNHNQSGFTLIELMISMILGLLISAAVMQVYIINAKTASIQDGASDVIEGATFSVPIIEQRIRLAGLGLAQKVKDNEPGSGIIFTSAANAPKDSENKTLLDNLKNLDDTNNDGTPKDITLDGNPLAIALLTHTGDETTTGSNNEWTGISNFDSKSGQLTVQYRAPQNMYDCEGNLVLGPRQVEVGGVLETIDGQVVIERFYLRAPNSSKPNEISLYCDAGKYLTEVMDEYEQQSNLNKPPNSVKFEKNNVIKDLGDAGQEIMSHVDYFDILLITQKDPNLKSTPADDNTVQYYTVKDYLTLSEDIKPVVVGIKYALILRSKKALLPEEGSTQFKALNNSLTLKSGVNEKYLRTVIDSDIKLRNADSYNDITTD